MLPHLGLIGGIGPAATDYYYRGLVRRMALEERPFDMTVVHADAPTLLGNMAAGAVDAQAEIFARLTHRLKSAGARQVAVTSIAGHFCSNQFTAQSALPVISLLDAVASHLKDAGLSRVGILGTGTAMTSGMYGALGSVEVVPPDGTEFDAVHSAYVAMATSGEVTQGQRDVFLMAGQRLYRDLAVDAVLLGGTDLFLVFETLDEPGFPVIDCAKIHMDAIQQAISS